MSVGARVATLLLDANDQSRLDMLRGFLGGKRSDAIRLAVAMGRHIFNGATPEDLQTVAGKAGVCSKVSIRLREGEFWGELGANNPSLFIRAILKVAVSNWVMRSLDNDLRRQAAHNELAGQTAHYQSVIRKQWKEL